MGFYYVAMRYNPQKRTGAEALADSRAETVRITFKTPLPYYPYLEPALRPNTTNEKRRALQLWLATDRPALPVAARTRDGRTVWVRPMREGANFEDARTTLLKALPDAPELLPAGRLTVQTFQDQKRSRSGFGDMLFLPKKRRPLSATPLPN